MKLVNIPFRVPVFYAIITYLLRRCEKGRRNIYGVTNVFYPHEGVPSTRIKGDQMRKKGEITYLARFRSKTLEESYYREHLDSSRTVAKHTILSSGLVFFLICLFDWGYNADKAMFWRSTTARFIVIVFAVISFLVISRSKKPGMISAAITLFPPILVVAYIYILAQQSAQGFLNQAMAIMVVLFCTTLLPVRWINIVVMDVFISAFFVLYSTSYITDAKGSDYAEVSIYLALTLVFTIIVQFRQNCARREKYLWGKQLERQAVTDKLTGVYNRLWLDRTLSDWCAGRGNLDSFSVVLMDIDDFKTINDTYGHLVGDEVLVEGVNIIKKSVRATDYLARWGGEEFVLLLSGVDMDKAIEIAENIRINIEAHEFGEAGRVTFSFGVAAFVEGDTPESLMRKVDKMLYVVKTSGKNRVEAYRQG